MNPRVLVAIFAASAIAVAVVVAVALAQLEDGDAAPPTKGGLAGSLRPPNVPPQDFALRDQDGKVTRLADFHGKPLILTFMYSTCRDTCPLQADQIRGALDQLGGDGVPSVAISVDPKGDTPDRAKAFLARRGLTGRMRFLLGSRAELAPLWKAYGIEPQGKRFDHSAYVLVLDEQGRQRVGFPLSQLTPEALAHDVRALSA